jgi:phytoene dehydrogenase-like protein
MAPEHDAIVVGAGHNGLACACHLAREGLRVLVVELHPSIGGMTRSFEMTLPGFTHDVHAAGIQVANLSPSLEELGLSKRGFTMLRPPLNYVQLFPDGRAVEFHRDLDRTCESLARYSRADARRWRLLMQEFEADRERIVEELFRPPEPAAFGPERYATLRSWLDANFESEEVRTAFAAWGVHVGAAPDDPGGIVTSAFGTVIQAVGNNPVQGGMQHLPEALARFLRENGGEIVCRARVTKLLVEAGQVRGVRLEDGTEYRAPLVAASLNPILLARDLITEEELGAGVAEKMKNVKNAAAQMSIWLALDRPVEFRAGEYFHRSLYAHASLPSLAALQSTMERVRSGVLPADPMLLFVNEGGVDPTRVPPGRSSMRILVLPLPWEIREDARAAVPGASWEQARESYADHVIQLAERYYVPGLRGRILKRVVHDPVMMSRESPDCHRGDVSHVGMLPEQSGAMRPIPEMGRYRTPIRGLYLCGSGTHPGSGVTLACGRNAARVILDDLDHRSTDPDTPPPEKT